MQAERSRRATGEWRILAIAGLSVLLGACTTATDQTFQMSNPSFAGGNAVTAGDDSAATDGSVIVNGEGSGEEVAVAAGGDAMAPVTSAEGDTELPVTVAYMPVANPAGVFPAGPVTKEPTQQTASAEPAQTESAAPPSLAVQQNTEALAMENPVYVTATDPQPTAPVEQKKRSFLSSLFGAAPAEASPAAKAFRAAPARPVIATATSEPKPLVQLASAGGNQPIVDALDGESSLPGVRQTALFEIKRKSGIDDDSDVDLHEDEAPTYQVASAAGLARLAPNGLLTQTEKVDVACLKPSLVRALKIVEQHYGRKMVVTSGYRSPAHNRRARGAKNSLHMYCAAADVQVQGVSKWELAKFVRSLPGRGGVGTYCHTESVHIDVGPERDWNWRCRRRKG